MTAPGLTGLLVGVTFIVIGIVRRDGFGFVLAVVPLCVALVDYLEARRNRRREEDRE